MGKHISMSDAKGSQGDIQRLVEHNPGLLTARVQTAFKLPQELQINWLSPVPPNYVEYSDEDFLDVLGLSRDAIRLHDFWPKGGPHWDGLGRGTDGSIFLIEAKAHIGEIVSSPCDAEGEARSRITAQLERNKASLHAKKDIDWTAHFFQYANRLAHLHFLRFEAKASAFLIFLYFIGDTYVHGPTTADEWRGAVHLLHAFLGIGRTKLTPYMADIFIGVDEIMSNQPIQPTWNPRT